MEMGPAARAARNGAGLSTVGDDGGPHAKEEEAALERLRGRGEGEETMGEVVMVVMAEAGKGRLGWGGVG